MSNKHTSPSPRWPFVTEITGKDFIDKGILHHINKTALHPLGLALSIDPKDDTMAIVATGNREQIFFDLPHEVTKAKTEALDEFLRRAHHLA